MFHDFTMWSYQKIRVFKNNRFLAALIKRRLEIFIPKKNQKNFFFKNIVIKLLNN